MRWLACATPAPLLLFLRPEPFVSLNIWLFTSFPQSEVECGWVANRDDHPYASRPACARVA